MKRFSSFLPLAVLLFGTGLAHGQYGPTTSYGLEQGQAPALQISGEFQATHANAPPGQCGCFWMEGGGVEMNLSVRPAWSAMTDIYYGSNANVDGTGERISVFNYLFGPRYAYRTPSRFTPYAQALGGISHVSSNYVIYSSNSSFLAAEAGLGVEMYLKPKLAIVPAEADWVFSHAVNNVNTRQNNLRIGFGVVYRMGPH